MQEGDSQNVQVIVRVRPLTTSYHATQGQKIVQGARSDQEKRCIKEVIASKEIILESKDKFTFDFVANEDITQDEMFNRLGKPIVDYCLQGYNSTIFAYGQSGSGKTFTI